MTDRYSMREARELLQTNEKSLQVWLRKAEIEAQIDLLDERKKYITKTQLEQLARLHDRILPELQEKKAPSAPLSGEALAAHITMIQQALEHRLDLVDQALHQVLTLLQAQASASPGETPPGQEVAVPQPASREQTRTVPTVRPKKKKTTRTKGQKLPQTYVPLRLFALAHQVSLKATEFASKAGKIAVERGQWRYNNHLYVEALSPTGQREFYQRFHAREGFIACEHCPHEFSTSS